MKTFAPTTALALSLVAAPATLAVGTHFEGFEDPGYTSGGDNWNAFNSTVTRVTTGTNGIASKTGAAHAIVDATADAQTGAFTRFDGYSSSFDNGFITSVDVYIDLADPAVVADTYGWDLSFAASTQAGGHLRDFIFHTASNASGEVLVGGSNNSNFTRRNDIAGLNHHVINSSGWYTFEADFHDKGDDTLEVNLNLYDGSGSLVFTEVRNDPSDLVSSVVGGNRYGWFTFLETDSLAIDNTELIPEPASLALVGLGGLTLVGRRRSRG